MNQERPHFELLYGIPDENQQLAEAVDVVWHAMWQRTRGRRGRNPSMIYSGSRSRNPRECLRRAYEDLGFSSFQDAKTWLHENPADWSKKLSLNIKPKPLDVEGLEFTLTHPSVQLDYPIRLQRYLTHLNQYDLADVRPIIFGIKDAGGKQSRFMMKIMSDPRPNEQNSMVFDGRLIMRKGQAVHCLEGETHAIFPGHMARIHINPSQKLRHVEFLDLPAYE